MRRLAPLIVLLSLAACGGHRAPASAPDPKAAAPAPSFRSRSTTAPATPTRASANSRSARTGTDELPPAPEIPGDVVAATRERYVTAY